MRWRLVRSRIIDNDDTNLFTRLWNDEYKNLTNHNDYYGYWKYREGLFLTLRKATIYSQLSLKTDTSRGGITGAIHSTKIPTGPTGKIGPPQKVDPFFRNFPVGPNRSIEFWTEISGNFGWMDRALSVCLKKGFVQEKAWRKAADQHQLFVCGRTVHLIEVSLRVSYKNVTKHKYLKTYWSIIAPCNAIQESIGFWIPHYGFRIPSINGFRIPCQWNFDSRFQLLAGFGMSELSFGFQTPGCQQLKISLILESGLPDMRRQPSILK